MLKYLKKFEKRNIGILGGSFNPPHHGHYFISKIGIKKLNLDLLLWIITNENPLKPKSKKNTNYKKKLSKSIIAPLAEKIKIEYLEKKINSPHTYDLLKFLKKKNSKAKYFFLMGADNFINFHKWHNWENISKLCKIVVFDRPGYSLKCLNSIASKKLRKKDWKFIKIKKIYISSSILRKI